ncbi:FAD-dependent monooxygenase [Pseudochelatococcus sp. B33]
MSKQSRPHIAIIGAGIGGMSTAIFLQNAGYECTVFEQTPEFRRLGAGINFGPNGTRVFHAMGLGKTMLETGIRPLSKSNRKWDTGETFYTFDNLELAEKYGSEFMAFHRADLHDMLVAAVAPDTVQLGKRLTGLKSDESSVRVRFEDGTELSFDAVIGADGLHSKVREYLLGTEPPIYFGHVAYRAVAPTAKLKGRLELADYIRWWGPEERYVLIYCMREDRGEYNIVASGAEELRSDELTPMPISLEHMRAAFSEFHPDACLVLENCEEVSRWPMMIRPPQRPWSRGRVTMLGDAAHPMTPHLGQGGGMAVEDAAMLVRCIEAVDGTDMELAFRLYEVNRFERTAEVQLASQENKIGRGARDPQWLFGYDVVSVPLQDVS